MSATDCTQNEETKLCWKCEKYKPLSSFNKCADRKDGLQAHCKACASRMYFANIDKARERRRTPHYKQIGKRSRERLMKQALIQYGGKCRLCGNDQMWTLTLAHTFNNGHEERGRGGNHLARKLKLLGYPTDLGIAVECYNCNCAANKENSWRRIERDKWLKERS